MNNAASGAEYMTDKELLASISTKLDLLMEYNKDDHDNMFKRLGALEQKSSVCPLHDDLVRSVVKLKVEDEKIKGVIDTNKATLMGEVKVLTVKISIAVTGIVIFVTALINKMARG